MPKQSDDPAYLRERARQARIVADLISDAVERERLLQTAERYEKLAEQAERRLAERKE